MTNWCCCHINIEGKGLEVLECVNSMKGKRAYYKEEGDEIYTKEWKDKICYTFNATAPVPKDKMTCSFNDVGYATQVELWGVKWDMLENATEELDQITKKCVDNIGEYDRYTFSLDTPWAPPIRWLAKLAKKFPMLTFEIIYEESVMALYGRAMYHMGLLCEKMECNESEHIYYGNDRDLFKTIDEIYLSWYQNLNDVEEEKEVLLADFEWYKDKNELKEVIDKYLKDVWS